MTEKSELLEPKGVIVTLIGPDGHVWVTVTESRDYGYGAGSSPKEAQKIAAYRALALELIRETCNANIAEAIPQHVCEDIVNTLIRKKEWRRTIKYIGYNEENEEGSDR